MVSPVVVKKRINLNKKPSQNDGSCVICCEEITFSATGACDHPICYKCSARMRVLSKQTYCATCRAEMDQVVISSRKKKFSDFQFDNLKSKRYHGFFFEDWKLAEEFDSLFDYSCVDCHHQEKFGSFEEFKTHIRRIHEKQFCQICVDTLSNFPREMKMYTKKELVSHRKDGDEKDRSHRGHPECRFCNDRFFDSDLLLLHLRKSHFWCHFCEHDGKQEYYNVYKDLRKHFADTHYLCDESFCRNEKYTSVFRDKIDYQAHKLASHGKNLNKIQAKEARKIEIDYSYRKRQQNSVVSGSDYTELQTESSRTGRNKGKERRDDRKKMDYSNIEDIGRERNELQKEKARKSHSEEKNERSMEHLNGAAAASFVSETNGTSLNQMYDSGNDDDDVIGLVEHINKSNEDMPTNMDRKPVLEKPPPINDNISKEKLNSNIEVSRRSDPAEDFPSLTGAPIVNIHVPSKKTKEEEFPTLDKPLLDRKFDSKKENSFGNASDKNGFNVKIKKEKKDIKSKEKGKSWTQQSGRGTFSSDFPSLQPSKKVNKMIPNTFDQNWENLSGKNGTGTRAKFPHHPEKSQDNFDKKVKQDAGGMNLILNEKKTKTFANSKEPPGFNGTRKKEDTPPGFSTITNFSTEGNLRDRNLRLVGMLQTYLDNFNLQLFKKLSGEFRKDLKPASVYYSDISELLGDNLKYVFSELVALLPDESKREELLKLHQNAKVLAKQKSECEKIDSPVMRKHKVWGASATPPLQNVSTNKETMTQCIDCGKTFPRDKAVEHMESHGEAFPSLPTAIKKKSNFSFQKTHQYSVKSPWTK